MTAQESVKDETACNGAAKTFERVKTLATEAKNKTIIWWKNSKEGREAFCSHAKTAAITAKNKLVTLWKSGTKGKVIICETLLLVICILLPLLMLKGKRSNTLASIERDSADQNVSRKGGHYTINGTIWKYAVDGNYAIITGLSLATPAKGDIIIPAKIGDKDYPVIRIGGMSFYECSDLTGVTIPDSVTSIGDYAFSKCSGLISVKIGKSVSNIGNSAFCDCTSLSNVTIPGSVTRIGDHAFNGCSGLTDITIPNSVKSIGFRAFYGCRSITIPDTITNIGEDAFENCSVTWLKSRVSKDESKSSPYRSTAEDGILAENGKYQVGNYTWTYSISNGNATIKGVMPATGNITLPSKIGKYSVTAIVNDAFRNCDGLTSITIPNSVTNIGDRAFFECGSLKSLAIPNGVTSIGLFAFKGCTNLMSVTGGKGVMRISDGAFKDCCKLAKNDFIMVGSMLCGYVGADKNVIIPKGVTYIGGGAFNECNDLTSVTMPNSVTRIGDHAFSNCDGLTSITIPSSVAGIGRCAFFLCGGLKSVTLPNELTVIGEFAFDGCRKLTSITIPASVKSIGEGAFSDCNGLTQINVDKDNTAYTSVNGLLLSKDGRTLIKGINGKVVIPNSVMKINNSAFNDCEGLTSVTIPASVTNIGDFAFSGCKSLTNVTIPEGVTTIGDWAFSGCHLKSVKIPDSVTSIGDKAFGYCVYLKNLSIPEAFADAIPSVFEKCVDLSEMIDMRRVKIRDIGISPESCRKEAEHGNVARAQYYIGMCYFEIGSMAEAAKWFRMAAERGHAGAQFELGYCYFIDRSEVDNMFKAMQWWRRAAAKGHKDAIFSLNTIPTDIRNGRRTIY